MIIKTSNRLTGWTTGVRFSEGAGNFSLCHCIHTDSEAHPTSYTNGYGGGGSYPGSKETGA